MVLPLGITTNLAIAQWGLPIVECKIIAQLSATNT